MELAEEWKSLAQNARISVSKFVVEHVENSLKQEQENKSSYASRAELVKQLKEKDGEVAQLKQDNELLKMLADYTQQVMREKTSCRF